MKLRLFIASSVILGFSIGTVWAADVAAGKEAFLNRCANCHGDNGEGKASIAKMMRVELHHLGSHAVQAKSDADLKKILLEGTGKMRAVKNVDAKMADDIVAFLRTLQEKE